MRTNGQQVEVLLKAFTSKQCMVFIKLMKDVLRFVFTGDKPLNSPQNVSYLVAKFKNGRAPSSMEMQLPDREIQRKGPGEM